MKNNTNIFLVLSSNFEIENILIKAFLPNKKKSITFNSKSIKEYELLPNYAKKIGYDFNKKGVSIKLFISFLEDVIGHYDYFFINSSGLSFSSIKKLSSAYLQIMNKINDKKLFFIHPVDKLDNEEMIIRRIDENIEKEIENIIISYKKQNNKTFKW